MWNSRLVILDEPTAALGVAQTRQVLDLVKRLAEQGLAVVLISHNLHDIFEVADRITVLRLGRNVAVFERRETTQQEVVHAITAGVPTKVAGHRRPRRPSRRHRVTDADCGRRPRHRRRTSPSPNSLRAHRAAQVGGVRRRETSAVLPVIVALILITIFFYDEEQQLPHRRATSPT